MKLPSYPKKGRSLALDFQQLLDWCRSNRISAVTGGKLKRTASGTVIEIDRKTPLPPQIQKHPFKIKVVDSSGPKLRIHYGLATSPIWAQAGGGDYMTTVTDFPLIGGGIPIGAPGGGTVGEIALSASTTYGVWLRYTLSTQGQTDGLTTPRAGKYSFLKHFAERGATANTEIVVSSTYTLKTEGVNFTASDSAYGYVYIGKVTLDADAVPTIEQWLRSDAFLPWATLPDDFISDDASNAITAGTDGALFLDDSGYVTGLAGGTDISVTDNNNGTWTINYTGT